MPDEKDIYRSAKLLLNQHQQLAESFALQKMEEFMNQGDVKSASVWLAIAQAITKLDQSKPHNAVIH